MNQILVWYANANNNKKEKQSEKTNQTNSKKKNILNMQTLSLNF